MILFTISFFCFLTVSANKESGLPFDDDQPSYDNDDDYHIDYQNDFKTPPPSPTYTEEEIQRAMRRFLNKPSIFNIIRTREIIVAAVFVFYIIFFILGKRSINQCVNKAKSVILNRLKSYYCVVSERMIASSLHRYDSFSTGRSTHIGCLTTLRLTRRCDILGYIFDKLLYKYRKRQKETNNAIDVLIEGNGKSSLTLEVAVEPAQKIPLVFHISEHEPFYANKFQLLKYPIAECESDRLSCYSDFEESTEYLIPFINEFLQKYPGLVSMIEISDVNRFELRGEGGSVVCASFNIDGKFESQAFSDEAVDFVIGLADKYATLNVPRDILDRMNRTRSSFIKEQQKELEEKGLIQKNDKNDKKKQ